MRQRTKRHKIQSNGVSIQHTSCPQTLTGMTADHSAEKGDGERKKEHDLFPWFSPWVICGLTIAVRVHYVLQPGNWWILHPDEIFQTLEVAHSEVYGFGFRPHEYLSATHISNISHIRVHEISMGMHSMRSFLLPRFYILVAWFAHWLGYTGKPFLLWKVAHTVVSSLLPMSVYMFAKRLFNSHDTGVLASVLTAGNTHLSVFGTHTLVNSFTATPLFYALAYIIGIVTEPSDNARRTVSSNNIPHEHRSDDDVKRATRCDIFQGIKEQNGKRVGLCNGSGNDVHQTKHYHQRSTMNNRSTLFYCCNTDDITLENKALWRSCFELLRNIFFSGSARHRSQRDVNMNFERTEPHNQRTKHQWRVHASSFLLVLCCYVRVDSILLVFCVLVPHLNRHIFRKASLFVPGGLAGLGLCITEDFISYGPGTITPLNWFNFNVLHDSSAVIFGRMGIMFYINEIFTGNPAVIVLSIYSVSVTLVLTLRYFKMDHLNHTNVAIVHKAFVSLTILLVLYSFKGHKELRFMYNFLVLLFVVFSYCLYIGATLFKKSSYAGQMITISVLLVYVMNQWRAFPSSEDQSVKPWTYAGHVYSHDVIACYDYVSRQNDVTGVFTEQMMHMGGGYTVLHHDVPILGLVHFEFYEFSINSQRDVLSADIPPMKKMIHVSTFTETSDFISIYNSQYLLKVLINRSHYNYFIISASRPFLTLGLEEVFRTKTTRVLRRRFVEPDEQRLKLYADKLPFGTNATVLAYEGQFLIRFSQLKLARERLHRALSLDPQILEAYKLLGMCYTMMNDSKSSTKTMGKCVQRFGKDKCYKKPRNIVFHGEYNLYS